MTSSLSMVEEIGIGKRHTAGDDDTPAHVYALCEIYDTAISEIRPACSPRLTGAKDVYSKVVQFFDRSERIRLRDVARGHVNRVLGSDLGRKR